MQGTNQRDAALAFGPVAFLYFLFTAVLCVPVTSLCP